MQITRNWNFKILMSGFKKKKIAESGIRLTKKRSILEELLVVMKICQKDLDQKNNELGYIALKANLEATKLTMNRTKATKKVEERLNWNHYRKIRERQHRSSL